MFAKQYFSAQYFPEQYFPPVVDIIVVQVEKTSSGARRVNIKHIRLVREDEEILVIVREFFDKCLD